MSVERAAQLMLHQKKQLHRSRMPIEKRYLNIIYVNHQPYLNFASNDYLGLSLHPLIKKAFIKGVQKYGMGSAASSVVSGYYKETKQLEEQFADFLQCDQALLFSSGYMANLAVVSTLTNRHSVILADKLCHASLLNGIQLSRAEYHRYQHNNLTHAEKLLQRYPQQKFILTESIFSMQGTLTPVQQIAALAKKYSAELIVDDAHATGIIGKQGRGICSYFQLTQDDVLALIVPLGKAFGSMGAIVAGRKNIIETLTQFAKTYQYTTAMPPATSCALLQALAIIQTENWRREKLQALSQFFHHQAQLRSLPLLSKDESAIKCILVEPNHALGIQRYLMQCGVYVAVIRPPTVPIHTTRIRITLNCLHTESEIIYLLDLLADVYFQND